MVKILVLDYNNILYKACAIHKELSHNNIYTGGLFGFTTMLCDYINVHKPDSIIVVCDCPPYLRTALYPNYKKRRKVVFDQEEKDKREYSRVIINKLLQVMSIPLWSIDGLEADDLMAKLVATNDKDDFILCSNDDDLFQILKFNVKMYKGKAKGYYTIDDFKKQYPNIDNSTDWVLIKAIAGSHNSVPGIKGYGLKRAIALVQTTIDGVEKLDNLYEQHKDEIDLYYDLVKLPLPNIGHIKLPTINRIRIQRGPVQRFLALYKIQPTFGISNALTLLGGY